MTKGTKAFRIIISILLAITMFFTAFVNFMFLVHLVQDIMGESYGIYVEGVSVTRRNEDDVLGDGTVSYSPGRNVLTLNNATLSGADTVIYSGIDLHIELIGENKITCEGEAYRIGIYAGDGHLAKDLAIIGDGTLAIDFAKRGEEAVGIYADTFTTLADITVKTSDCDTQVHGIVCESNLMIVDGGDVTVENGTGNYSVGARVRGNVLMEAESSLTISVQGAAEICKGLSVSGDIFLGQDANLSVAVDDGDAELGECIHVSGLFEIGSGATVTAVSQKSHAIECFGTIEANVDACVRAFSEEREIDLFCSSTIVDYGAEFEGEVEALCGIHPRD